MGSLHRPLRSANRNHETCDGTIASGPFALSGLHVVPGSLHHVHCHLNPCSVLSIMGVSPFPEEFDPPFLPAGVHLRVVMNIGAVSRTSASIFLLFAEVVVTVSKADLLDDCLSIT